MQSPSSTVLYAASPPFADSAPAGVASVLRALRSRNIALELELQRCEVFHSCALAARIGRVRADCLPRHSAGELLARTHQSESSAGSDDALDAERTRRGASDLRAETAEAECLDLQARVTRLEAVAAAVPRLQSELEATCTERNMLAAELLQLGEQNAALHRSRAAAVQEAEQARTELLTVQEVDNQQIAALWSHIKSSSGGASVTWASLNS